MSSTAAAPSSRSWRPASSAPSRSTCWRKRSGDERNFVGADRVDRGAKAGACERNVAVGPFDRRLREAVEGLWGDRAGGGGGSRSAAPAGRAGGPERDAPRRVRRGRAQGNG